MGRECDLKRVSPVYALVVAAAAVFEEGVVEVVDCVDARTAGSDMRIVALGSSGMQHRLVVFAGHCTWEPSRGNTACAECLVDTKDRVCVGSHVHYCLFGPFRAFELR